MRVQLDTTDKRPIYVQIMDEVRGALVRGTLSPEEPLPSVRELSSSLRVNPRTVSQAYSALEQEGLVHVRRGQGTFVSAGVRPGERERPKLAREAAKRALSDARRNGLTREELMEALRELDGIDASERGSSQDGAGEGAM